MLALSSVQRRGEDVALEADVVGLGRGEGGEVVGADEGGGAGVERLAVDLVRPPEGPAALERARRPGRSPPGRGRSASGRRGGRRSRRRPPRRGARRRPRGVTPFRLRARSGGSGASVSKLATCPRAWTPVSVRPATVSWISSRSTCASAASSTPWTVRSPGWRAQPRKPVPSYSMSSRTVVTAAVSPTPRRTCDLESTGCACCSPTTTGSPPPGCRACAGRWSRSTASRSSRSPPTPTAAPPPAASPPARRSRSRRSPSKTATSATRPTARRSTASASPSSASAAAGPT